MHPNGQLPAYEWNFGDVNPPVHAWSVFRTFKIERKMYGRQDLDFLERVFQKLLLNFTWWVNRKDFDGKNVFEGGFLGLDNIGLFNRSEPLPTGGVLEQADSTGWMAFYCLCMLNISLELAKHRRTYEDIASKFFEHFILISDAMSFRAGGGKKSLWNDEDGFYYDAISWGGPWTQQMPVRSLVGLIPLYAVMTLEPELINKFPNFKRRMDWFIENRHDVAERNIASMRKRGKDERLLLSLVSKERLVKILDKMLDEGRAQLWRTGVVVDMCNLQPEVTALLLIKDPEWYTFHSSTHGKNPGEFININEEFRTPEESYKRAPHLGASRFSSPRLIYQPERTDITIYNSELLEASHMEPWDSVPPGAAAFWLGIDALRKMDLS